MATCNKILGLRSAGVKYEDAQCDSYTNRGRNRSMGHVITAGDLASGP